jgi:type II secretory pathway pseudopilin PulG
MDEDSFFYEDKTMRKEKGFSMLETVVVSGIVLLASAISVPSIIKANKTYNLNSAASGVALSLQKARLEAIRNNASSTVVIDTGLGTIVNNQTVVIAGAPTVKTSTIFLPQGVEFKNLPETISAPPMVVTSFEKKSSFTEDSYKNLANSKVTSSFTPSTTTTSTTTNSGTSGSGTSGSCNSGTAGSVPVTATFTSKGVPGKSDGKMSDPGMVNWVYLKSSNDEWITITVTSVGSTQIWRYKNGSWQSNSNT